jgi:hypothetical protein
VDYPTDIIGLGAECEEVLTDKGDNGKGRGKKKPTKKRVAKKTPPQPPGAKPSDPGEQAAADQLKANRPKMMDKFKKAQKGKEN